MKLQKMRQYLHKLAAFLWHRRLIQYFIPTELYLSVQYKNYMGKSLNLKHPQTFNEKLQWLKIYDRNPKYTNLVDKYEVRNYIARTIGEKFLIPIYGVYQNYEDIEFDRLPEEFVLKPNHTSGDVYICRNKSDINHCQLKRMVKRWLRKRYYWVHREWPYKNIKPRIICEKYMVDESGSELKDYKFMCFNGRVKCLFVCRNRNSASGLNVDFYDTDWKPLPFIRHYPNSGEILPKPKNFDQMKKFAEVLAKEIPCVRIDFYEVEEILYFGEMTFYPGSGYEEFSPETYDYMLGDWLTLPDYGG